MPALGDAQDVAGEGVDADAHPGAGCSGSTSSAAFPSLSVVVPAPTAGRVHGDALLVGRGEGVRGRAGHGVPRPAVP